MRRIGYGLATVVMILVSTGESACQTVDSGGQVGIKECWVDTTGITVTGRGNTVEDYVTARCGPATFPQKHTLKAWLEIRGDEGEYRQVGEYRIKFNIPDNEGVGVRISADCQPGRFRAAWRAYGVSSGGTPFDYTDHDFFATRITETDCWG